MVNVRLGLTVNFILVHRFNDITDVTQSIHNNEVKIQNIVVILHCTMYDCIVELKSDVGCND